MNKTKTDISAENFDLFFSREFENISPQAKDGLPKDLSFKLFRKGGEFNSKSTSKLGFIEKLFVLWKCLNKRWWIVIEDEHKGISADQFVALKNAPKIRDYTIEQSEELIASGTFILASNELCNTFSYLNHLGASGAYNYLIKAKNSPKNKVTEAQKEKSWVANFLANYDGQKKNIVANTGLTIPEFYVLLCLYDGSEVASSSIYKEKFKRAYQSTPSKIKLAFGTLQHRGYITKYGVVKGVKLKITPLGKDVLNGIFDKYIFN